MVSELACLVLDSDWMHIVICGSYRCDLFLFLLIVLCDRLVFARDDMIACSRWVVSRRVHDFYHDRVFMVVSRLASTGRVSAIGPDSDCKSMKHGKLRSGLPLHDLLSTTSLAGSGRGGGVVL